MTFAKMGLCNCTEHWWWCPPPGEGQEPSPSGTRGPSLARVARGPPRPSQGYCTLVDKAGVEAPGVAQQKALREQGRQ